MKNWKSLLLTIFSFFAITSMVVLSSCEKDPCSDLSCQNGGSCSDGYCQCPTGYEGAECDITAASRFVGVYSGSLKCGDLPMTADTITIELVKEPDEVSLKIGAGNTALQGLSGKVVTPESRFSSVTVDGTTVHAYFSVDGNQIALYIETINESTNTRQICRFTGSKIVD